MAFATTRSIFLGSALVLAGAAGIGLIAACGDDDDNPTAPPGGNSSSSSSGGAIDSGPSATCAAPGAPTPGTPDTHCKEKPAQAVNPASCHPPDAGTGDDDDDASCEYGPTQFGTSGTDDDCKYVISYVADPICEGKINFAVTIKTATDMAPVTGITEGIDIEAFIPTDVNQTCDAHTTHPSPDATPLMEDPATPGTYKGTVTFDSAGQWTVRFHVQEDCSDSTEDSPHGHIAFRFTVP